MMPLCFDNRLNARERLDWFVSLGLDICYGKDITLSMLVEKDIVLHHMFYCLDKLFKEIAILNFERVPVYHILYREDFDEEHIVELISYYGVEIINHIDLEHDLIVIYCDDDGRRVSQYHQGSFWEFFMNLLSFFNDLDDDFYEDYSDTINYVIDEFKNFDFFDSEV